MKKFLIVVLMILLSLSLVIFGACAGDSDNHNYSSTWSYDGTHHYKPCTDSGCSEVKDKATHDIKDGSCSICGYNNFVTVTASEDNYRTVLKSLNEGDIVGLTDGQYIKVSTGEADCIVVGQNTWADIPGRNETAFCGIDEGYIVYDRTEQLTVEE